MKIIRLEKDFDIYDILEECTEQAKGNLQTIIDNNKEDEFINYLIDYMYTDINSVVDLLHHDWQELFKELEIEED